MIFWTCTNLCIGIYSFKGFYHCLWQLVIHFQNLKPTNYSKCSTMFACFCFLQHVSLFGVSFGDVCSGPASAMKVIFRSLLQMPLPLCGRRCDGTQTNKHKLCYHHAGSSKHDNLETLLVGRMKYKTKHAHILQHHVCLKLKIIKLFTSRVGSLNKASLKQQEALKRVSAIPYLLSTTIP